MRLKITTASVLEVQLDFRQIWLQPEVCIKRYYCFFLQPVIFIAKCNVVNIQIANELILLSYWLLNSCEAQLKANLTQRMQKSNSVHKKKTCFFLAFQELPTLVSQHPHLSLRRAVLHAQIDNKVNFFKKAKKFLTHFEFRS